MMLFILRLCLPHWYDTYLKELSCVLIAVIDADAASKDADIDAYSEITWKHGDARAVLLQDHLSLEEDALRSAAVLLSGLTNHDRVIFQVVEDDQLANLVVL